MNKSLPKKIIDLRERVDMKQAELARRLSIDKSAMSKIESGTRKVSSDELKKIAEIFDVSTDYLLGTGKKQTAQDETHTIAAHLDKDLSDKDKQEIMSFIDYIKHRDHSSDSDK